MLGQSELGDAEAHRKGRGRIARLVASLLSSRPLLMLDEKVGEDPPDPLTRPFPEPRPQTSRPSDIPSLSDISNKVKLGPRRQRRPSAFRSEATEVEQHPATWERQYKEHRRLLLARTRFPNTSIFRRQLTE